MINLRIFEIKCSFFFQWNISDLYGILTLLKPYMQREKHIHFCEIFEIVGPENVAGSFINKIL